jgi:tetratricopeptide (TPR) repeat protein
MPPIWRYHRGNIVLSISMTFPARKSSVAHLRGYRALFVRLICILHIIAAGNVLGAEDPAFADHFNRGIALQNNGQYERALSELEEAIRIDATSPLPYINRGVIFRIQGRLEDAIADFTRAIEAKPKHDYVPNYNGRQQAYLRRGEIYLIQLKQYAKAIADFDKAIELDPMDADALNKRGHTYALLGQHEKAIADETRALQLKPDDPNALQGLRYSQQEFAKSRATQDTRTNSSIANNGPPQQSNLQKWFNLTQTQANPYVQTMIDEAKKNEPQGITRGGAIVLTANGAHVWSEAEIFALASLVIVVVGAVAFVAGRGTAKSASPRPPSPPAT